MCKNMSRRSYLTSDLVIVVKAEEWRAQLHRCQRQMKELAGESEESLDVDFDIPASEVEGDSEAASTAPGMP